MPRTGDKFNLALRIDQKEASSNLVILKSEVLNDENLIIVPLAESLHEYNIAGLDGDEEVWLLY